MANIARPSTGRTGKPAAPIGARVVSLKARTAMMGCTVPLAIVVMFGLVMGSGILPIPLWLLIAAAAMTAALLTLPGILLGSRRLAFGVLTTVAIVGTVISASMIFGHFQDKGFELAKEYGRGLAQSLAAAQVATGEWPADLKDLPADARPPVNIPTPYLAFCDEGICGKVAGYFIDYRLDAGAPHFTVSRRDISAQWNWSLRQFEERR